MVSAMSEGSADFRQTGNGQGIRCGVSGELPTQNGRAQRLWGAAPGKVDVRAQGLASVKGEQTLKQALFGLGIGDGCVGQRFKDVEKVIGTLSKGAFVQANATIGVIEFERAFIRSIGVKMELKVLSIHDQGIAFDLREPIQIP